MFLFVQNMFPTVVSCFIKIGGGNLTKPARGCLHLVMRCKPITSTMHRIIQQNHPHKQPNMLTMIRDPYPSWNQSR
jgi:hypothetical protein